MSWLTWHPCCCRRRELFARAGAAVVGFSAAQAASAKAGQFSKIDIFSLAGQEAISSPYQPGGPASGPDATFGYKKSAGAILAKGYEVRDCAACYTSRAYRRQMFIVDSPCFHIDLPPPPRWRPAPPRWRNPRGSVAHVRALDLPRAAGGRDA